MSGVSRFRLTAVCAALFLSMAAGLPAQELDPARAWGTTARDPALYEQEFVGASLTDKSYTLMVAAADVQAATFMPALYDKALDFAFANAKLFGESTDMMHLIETAAKGAVSSHSTSSRPLLWKVFLAYNDSRARVPVLNALGELGKGSRDVILNLNRFLAQQTDLFGSGTLPDYDTVIACVKALGVLADSSSADPLAAAMTAGFPQDIPEEAAGSLWQVFLFSEDSKTRIGALEVLAAAGKGNRVIIRNMNEYLDSKNNLFRAGKAPDYGELQACIWALGILGDMSSFPVLFSALAVGYPQRVRDETAKALDSLQGDITPYLVEIINKSPMNEKLAAFRLGAYNSQLSVVDKGTLAEAAMGIALDIAAPGAEGRAGITPEVVSQAASLRYAAAQVFTQTEWVRAAPLAIRHFHQTVAEFERGAVDKTRLVEAVKCLEAMKTLEAAEVLSVQLGIYNAQTEKSRQFDEDIIMALVTALGKIGNKTAFNYLLFVGLLPYSEAVHLAARDALHNLKW